MIGGIRTKDEIDSNGFGYLYRWHLDWPLLLGLAVLSTLGLVILYGAGGQEMDVVLRQALRLGLGFVVVFVLAQIPSHHLRVWTPWLFAAGLGLLIAVLLIGDIGKGAQRWLDFGIIRFQPSEMMKIAVPMMVAWYLAEKPLPPKIVHVLITMLIIVIPALLIAKQPDLGTALLVASAGIFALFLAGLGWKLIITGIGLFAAFTPALWYLMHDYQRKRVLMFLNPESDPLGAGYHIIQSKIAIGSGGIYGKGWLNGTQSQLEFIPERSTDFIFAVIGEEFGLLGILVLLSVYLSIILRGLYIAVHAQDTFSRLLAGSLSLTFCVYVIVNTGMVTGLLPVVGVPLPLVSYGGTSVVTIMAAFGILMSIQAHRKLLPH